MTKNEHGGNQTWLKEHREVVRSTDQLKAQDRYADILVLGLVGEVGSIMSERKKARREQEAYPRHRHRLTEELGDALWYLLRILDTFGCDIATLDRLGEPERSRTRDDIDDALELGTAAGDLLRVTRQPTGVESIQIAVECVVAALSNVAARAEMQSGVCSVMLIVWPWAPPHNVHPCRQLPDLLFAYCRLLLSGGGV